MEDVYEPGLPNLDAFLVDLASALGPHPVLEQVARTVEFFRVLYVLNSFNGVDEAFDTAVKPFVENLVSTVSERMTLTNLGWVVKSDEVHLGNCRKRPVLLLPARRPRRGASDPWRPGARRRSSARRPASPPSRRS